MQQTYKIESLLAARLFLSPRIVGNRIYFISDLSGRLSLYAMDAGGSVPEPLLPPNIALQNPALVGGYPYAVFPRLGQIVVMIDQDGDENYQPYVVSVDGGIPELLLGERFAGKQLFLLHADIERDIVALHVDHRTAPEQDAYLVDLHTLEMTHLGSSIYGNYFSGATEDYTKIILQDGYTSADNVLYLWTANGKGRELLYGTPLEARQEGERVPLTGFGMCYFTPAGGVLTSTVLFDDRGGLAYFPLATPEAIGPVEVTGLIHEGDGEFEGLEHLADDRYALVYNIDGVSWIYEGTFDEVSRRFNVTHVLVGQDELSNGVVQAFYYDKEGDVFSLSFSRATSPAQIYTLEGPERRVVCHTRERVLGIPATLLSAGEDASYESHDGLRISARLYLPAPELGYEGPRPVIFYIHGGPQSQERPDFTWFSMPLIQFFTLNGFAVFVPNVRGSHGYGIDYMKRVDQDWGGADRLDHVAGFESLRDDPRLDLSRAGVMGRSYGGYMTLMQVGKHPDLWAAAVDMFGPYSLLSFLDRIPETWKTYFYLAIGHPERDRERLLEQSPSTHLHNLACPMLVIQGRNDPRVVARESEDLVEALRAQGKDVSLLVMENEGHDVLKYENKVRVYNAIVDFFKTHLRPD